MPKPSFGCMVCRQRRVKCDERVGGCVRCERSRITCPGYQHPLDVVLRHLGTGQAVSHGVAGVSQLSRMNGAEIQDQERPFTWPSMELESTTLTSQSGLVRQPSVDPEQAALGAYYSSYCVSSYTICSLDHIREQGNGCLWAAIKTLGMMQLHQVWQLPHGIDAVTSQYTNATTLLNTALASPAESRQDSTLLATLMLSVVEMKASPDFTLRYWLVHTKGAAALMELRGADQVSSRLGAALFLQISSQIVIYCILGRRHIPCELRSLRSKVRPHVVHTDHPLWQWHGLMYRFVNFLATAYAIKPELVLEDAQATIAEALSIYHDMESVFQGAGMLWEYDTQPGDDFSPLIGHEHIYHSLLVTRVWNDRRTAKILLFAVIARIAARCYDERTQLDKDPQLYKKDACEAIRNAALETLAAVPQMLAGLKGKSSAQQTSTSIQGVRLCESSSEYDERVFQQTRKDATTLPFMDTCRVQWPIYFAVQCEFVEPVIRSYLLQVLDDFGKAMQMKQWQILAESVRSTL